jgi:hypothetical protein
MTAEMHTNSQLLLVRMSHTTSPCPLWKNPASAAQFRSFAAGCQQGVIAFVPRGSVVVISRCAHQSITTTRPRFCNSPASSRRSNFALAAPSFVASQLLASGACTVAGRFFLRARARRRMAPAAPMAAHWIKRRIEKRLVGLNCIANPRMIQLALRNVMWLSLKKLPRKWQLPQTS